MINILFFIVSKIIPNIFLPLGLSFIILIKNISNKSKNYCILLIIFLYFFSIKITSQSLLFFTEYPLKYKNIAKLPNADAIVVLSGGGVTHLNDAQNLFQWNNPKRFLAGLQVYKSNKSKILLFTGGENPFSKSQYNEGQLYKKAAINFGINPKHIKVTKSVYNTYYESIEIKKELSILKLNNEKPKVILITSAYHMPRAQFLFNKQGIDTETFPVDFRSGSSTIKETISNPISWIPTAKDLYISSFSLREIIGRIFYKIFLR